MSEKPEPEPPLASFEAGLSELESVVKDLESGELPLERALELFAKGVELSERCRRQLEAAETRVELLVKQNEEVAPEPFRLDQE